MPSRELAKKTSKKTKIMEQVERILQERSVKSFDVAKKIILNEKRECKEINDAFEYYVKNWVDYTHVGLISLACDAVNGDSDDVVPVQASMLFLTAAVDVHDDIIDKSKTKYGRPTLFGKFGKDITLLVGDAFLVKSLTLLHKLEGQVSRQRINAIWDIINRQFFEMGDAEATEASLKGSIDFSPEEYLRILEKKASNFEIHMRIGAIIGGGKQSEIDLLGDYGKTLGILTGVREDFIDIFEPEELQNRIKNELLPLPILYAFKNAQTKKTIMNILSKQKISNKDAEKIVGIVFEEKNVKIFREKIQRLAEKASKSISIHNRCASSQMQILLAGVLEDL